MYKNFEDIKYINILKLKKVIYISIFIYRN